MNERAEAPNSYKYGTLAANGTDYVTVIPACNPNAAGGALDSSNSSYRIGNVTVWNADNANVTVKVWINNGAGTRVQIDQSTALTTGSSYTTHDKYWNGIMVRGPEFIEVNLAGDPTTSPNYYSSWVEVRP